MSARGIQLVLPLLASIWVGCEPVHDARDGRVHDPVAQVAPSKPVAAPTTVQQPSLPGRNAPTALRESAALMGSYGAGPRHILRLRDSAIVSRQRSSGRLTTPWVAEADDLGIELSIVRLANGNLGVLMPCRSETPFQAQRCWRIEEYAGRPLEAEVIYLDAPQEIAQELADALRDLVMSLQQPSTTQ